ncbi:hypothetical protein NL676_009497 [Syzygium grande]|nr:hypothetical protein NL676_009497 [Syzygium grande]
MMPEQREDRTIETSIFYGWILPLEPVGEYPWACPSWKISRGLTLRFAMDYIARRAKLLLLRPAKERRLHDGPVRPPRAPDAAAAAAAAAFPIDDLLDLSNADLFSSSSSSDDHDRHHLLLHPPPPPPREDHHRPASSSAARHRLRADSSPSSPPPPSSTAAFPPFCADFAHELCVPSDYAAELEWLSRFVDDSFADVPASEFPGAPTTALLPDAAFSGGRPRSKRSRPPGAPAAAPGRIRSPAGEGAGPAEAEGGGGGGGAGRRCAHCASEKTPQWRTGPLGPKTLCNACGVRYKSGRLVPEYRPAASPTFVLTQHSNSHRKVMELRRQKEARQAAQPQHHPRAAAAEEGGKPIVTRGTSRSADVAGAVSFGMTWIRTARASTPFPM